MTNLIINRVNYLLSDERPNIYLSKKDNFIFRMQFLHFSRLISSRFLSEEYQLWSNDLKEADYIYYSFTNPHSSDYFEMKVEEYFFRIFKEKYIKELLINFFVKNNFLVQPYSIGRGISVYEKTSDFNSEWGLYTRYDLQVKANRNELLFNIGSEKTLISNFFEEFHNSDNISIVDINDNFIKRLGGRENINNCRIIANAIRRRQILGDEPPRKFNYRNLFTNLSLFYNSQLMSIDTEHIRIVAGGLKNVEQGDLNKVNINENLMLFGKEMTDINAVTGMRDYGIYKPSPKASDVKFIFVYENSIDANQLYLYLKNGLKHYPGLWSYVGIPIRLSDLKIQYSGVDDLKSRMDDFLAEKLPNEYYSDLLAVIINPNSSQDKEEVEEDENPMYYEIKRKFLEKGIPTQFIQDKNIHSGSFHYFLPNISIGILAKLGGIPWRLKTKKTDELVIGFNQKSIGENRFIGSAVFFSNDGELGKTFGFPETNSEKALISNLKSAIEQYIFQKKSPPERLVIHYYKPHSGREQKSIEELIQKELRLNIPFAIVEINDTKSQMDICFDKDFTMGMPESGTYVRVSKTEYLLFNNTRYQKNPLRNVAEELPIKIAIHFADTGGFSHKDLISQVYEFSRLYWKGLKQKSQPATTIYAKLIADFIANYSGILPNNETVNNTPWFL